MSTVHGTVVPGYESVKELFAKVRKHNFLRYFYCTVTAKIMFVCKVFLFHHLSRTWPLDPTLTASYVFTSRAASSLTCGVRPHLPGSRIQSMEPTHSRLVSVLQKAWQPYALDAWLTRVCSTMMRRFPSTGLNLRRMARMK